MTSARYGRMFLKMSCNSSVQWWSSSSTSHQPTSCVLFNTVCSVLLASFAVSHEVNGSHIWDIIYNLSWYLERPPRWPAAGYDVTSCFRTAAKWTHLLARFVNIMIPASRLSWLCSERECMERFSSWMAYLADFCWAIYSAGSKTFLPAPPPIC